MRSLLEVNEQSEPERNAADAVRNALGKKKRQPIGLPFFFAFEFFLLADGSNAHERLTTLFLAERYGTIYESEESVVFTHTHIFTGVVYGTTLADENVACFCKFTAEQFYAESFALRLTAVL